jgi:hypothetical protein
VNTTDRDPAKAASQATLIVDLVLGTADLELFHTDEAEPFVVVPAGSHREVWPLRGGPFRRWIARMFYETHGKAAGGQALADALGVLEGEALFRGVQHDVHLRIAEHESAIYIDLADDFWQQIKITATGWEIITGDTVRFRRSRGMRPLPYPAAAGDLDELRNFVNVADDEWPLLAAWAVAALRPRGPYPVLQLHGEQGTAKSTTARVLRELVDPNAAPLRSEPRDGRDLMLAAHNGWIVGYDNVSHLTPWLSDAICRLSTGGGFSTRELYSDKDEVLIDVQRPVIVNGIDELGTRGDLLDRSLVLYLPRIGAYRPEADFWADFEQVRPRILGALLDAVAGALKNLPTVRLARSPRMADFALWSTAAEKTMGLAPGAFMTAYDGNRADAHQLSLEASPISAPLREVAHEGFSGTATELLDRLATIVSDDSTRAKSWPKSASALAGTLRRLAPNLRATGIEIDFDRTGSRRLIVIGTAPKNVVITVTPVTANDDDDANDDVFPDRSNQGVFA